MKEVYILSFLGVNSLTDLKKHQISLAAVVIFAVGGAFISLREGAGVWELLASGTVGLVFAGISIVSRGAVGMGDALLLMALGTVMRMEELLGILFLGMLCSAVYAGMVLAVRRRGGETEIPFVPFLLMGYVGGLLLWGN